MKALLFLSLAFSVSAFAKDGLQDFHQTLIKNFQRELSDQEPVRIKKDTIPARGRGPASVAPTQIEPEKKLDKNDRQLGHRAW